MRNRLPIILSVTALIVALVGLTVGNAATRLILPKNSVGTPQIKNGSVKAPKLATAAVTSQKVRNASITGLDIKNGSIDLRDMRAGVVPTTAGGDLTGRFPNPTIAAGAVTPAMLAAVPGARVFNTAAEPIATATPTALSFDSERFDSGNVHAAGGDRIVAPSAGIYLVTANVLWGPQNNGNRELAIRRNGAAVVGRTTMISPATNQTPQQSLTTVVSLAVGDFVQAVVTQDSGATVNIDPSAESSPEFSVVRLSAAP